MYEPTGAGDSESRGWKAGIVSIPAWLASGLCLVGMAHAEVLQTAADGLLVVQAAPITSTPDKAWAALIQPQHWWDSARTWSGDAANLNLDPKAGGCFCERWPGGSAEHGRVVMVLDGQLLRLQASLEPLEEPSPDGLLSFWIATGDDGVTRIEIDYRVSGAGAGRAGDAYTTQLDALLAAQLARLVRYVDAGSPEPAEKRAAQPPPSAANKRAALFEAWAREAKAQAAARKSGSATVDPGAGERSRDTDGPEH